LNESEWFDLRERGRKTMQKWLNHFGEVFRKKENEFSISNPYVMERRRDID
jgi:hypothetical protein